MKQRMPNILLLAVLSALIITLIAPLSLAVESQYELRWWTVDSGGGIGQSSDGTYALNSTIGQSDVGPVQSGGVFTMIGGYWESGIPTEAAFEIFLPLVLRDS